MGEILYLRTVPIQFLLDFKCFTNMTCPICTGIYYYHPLSETEARGILLFVYGHVCISKHCSTTGMILQSEIAPRIRHPHHMHCRTGSVEEAVISD